MQTGSDLKSDKKTPNSEKASEVYKQQIVRNTKKE